MVHVHANLQSKLALCVFSQLQHVKCETTTRTGYGHMDEKLASLPGKPLLMHVSRQLSLTKSLVTWQQHLSCCYVYNTSSCHHAHHP